MDENDINLLISKYEGHKMLKRIQKQKQSSIASLLPQRKKTTNNGGFDNVQSNDSFPLNNHSQDNVQNNGSFLVQPQISPEHSTTHDSDDDLNNEMDIERK